MTARRAVGSGGVACLPRRATMQACKPGAGENTCGISEITRSIHRGQTLASRSMASRSVVTQSVAKQGAESKQGAERMCALRRIALLLKMSPPRVVVSNAIWSGAVRPGADQPLVNWRREMNPRQMWPHEIWPHGIRPKVRRRYMSPPPTVRTATGNPASGATIRSSPHRTRRRDQA